MASRCFCLGAWMSKSTEFFLLRRRWSKHLGQVYFAALAMVLAGLTTASGAYAQTTSQLSREISLIPNQITSAVDNDSRVTLHGSLSPLIRSAADQGLVPESLQLPQLHFFFKHSAAQEADLHQLLAEQRDPSSPEYHHWLTPAEFGARFGPSVQDVSTVEAWLASQGFGNMKLEPSRQVLSFSGSASQFSNTFHANFHRYALSGHSYYSVASSPQIPAALATVVQGFSSLNNFPLHHYSHVLGQASYNPVTHKAKAEWTYPEGSGGVFFLAPQDFGVEYDLPNPSLNTHYSGTKYDGSGETIAILNDSNINVALVNSFRSLFGLPANPPQVVLAGNDPGINGDSSEAYLDVELSGAVAPAASIDLVIAANTPTQSGLVLAAQYAVYSDLAPIISMSFGACEATIGASGNQFISGLWQQAAAEGITVMVSSGDSGSAGCDNDSISPYASNGTMVNGYSSTPYNVSVGGTDFYYSQWNNGQSAINSQLANYWNLNSSNTPAESLTGYIPEQPWNDSQYGDNLADYYAAFGTTTIAGGGGGASNCATSTTDTKTDVVTCMGGYPKPAWQSGTGVPPDQVRDTPDVSLFAANGLNYSSYPICASDGDCQNVSASSPVQVTGIGGTSASSPAFAGIMALVDQANGGRQGQADVVLYPLAAQFPSAFHDVTVGTNSVPCEYSPTLSSNCIAVSSPITLTSSGEAVVEGQLGSGTTPDYNAGTGYDLATGLGSVDAAKLVADWSKITFASTSVTLTPSSTSFTHGTAITVSGSVAGGATSPTGSVALMSNSSSPMHGAIAGFTLKSGAFSGSVNNLPGGTYQIWAQYGGDTANAASASSKTSITVAPEASSLLLQLPNMNSSNSNQQAVSNGGSVPYGTQLILSAAPIPASCASTSCANTGFDAPTGSVTFTDSGTNLNIVTLDAEGVATDNIALGVGPHTLAASYAGDNSYNGSKAAPVSFTVTRATPTIYLTGPLTLGASSSTGTYTQGQANTLSVEVENNVNSALINTLGQSVSVPAAAPTGTIQVTITGPNGYSQSPLISLTSSTDAATGNPYGVGAVTLPATAPSGNYSVSVSYQGDSNYVPYKDSFPIVLSSAASQGIQVGTNVSSTSATLTGGNGSGGTASNSVLTVNATVTGVSGQAAPTGTVYLLANNQLIAKGSLVAPTSGVNSTTSITLNSGTSGLDQGSNVIQVQYSGDKNYAISSSSLTVTNSLSDFSMVPSTSFVAVSSGSQAVTPISIQSINGFVGTIQFSCTAGSGASCSLNPQTYSLAQNGSTVVQLTVKAGSSTSKALSPFAGWLGGGAALACGLLLVIPARRRSWRNMLGMLALVCVLGFAVGCGTSSNSKGGGSGGGSGGGTGGGSSTTGSYNPAYPNAVPVTVVATSGNITHTLVIVVNPTSGS